MHCGVAAMQFPVASKHWVVAFSAGRHSGTNGTFLCLIHLFPSSTGFAQEEHREDVLFMFETQSGVFHMSNPNPIEPTPLHMRLRDRLPEILIEAGSVVIALLLAQAAGIWHEQQQQQELASEARTAIVSEMRANEAELDKMRASMKMSIASLAATAQDKGAKDTKMSFSLYLALLSQSAWHASLDTGAMQHVDYGWTMKIAKVYELQELVLHAQSGVFDQLADFSDTDTQSPHVVAAHMLSRQRSLEELADGLDAGYRDALGDKR